MSHDPDSATPSPHDTATGADASPTRRGLSRRGMLAWAGAGGVGAAAGFAAAHLTDWAPEGAAAR